MPIDNENPSERSEAGPAAFSDHTSVTSSHVKLVVWLMPILVGLSAIAAFLPVLQNDFVDWDDDVNIVNNFNYRGLGWSQLRWMFTNLNMGHYQPLSWVTFGFDYLLWGINPFGYHLTSLMLHGANAVLTYFVALRLFSVTVHGSGASRKLALHLAAAFAALLFALHPLRVESVAWATERRGLLAGFFLLLSLLCYLEANVFSQSGYRHSRSGWSDDPSRIPHGSVQSNRVDQIFPASQIHDEGLRNRVVKGRQRPQHRNQSENGGNGN